MLWIDHLRYLLPLLSNNKLIIDKVEPSLWDILLPVAAAARCKSCRIADHRVFLYAQGCVAQLKK